MVTVVEGVVHVGPDVVTSEDILEYARLLIEEEGWNDTSQGYEPSSKDQGWTLHDAVGEAGTRLYDDKEGSGLRSRAYQLLDERIKERHPEVLGKDARSDEGRYFNDKATLEQVLAVLA